MKSLRIIMFTTFYPPYSFGGDGIGVQRMAQALVARGHEVSVVHDIDAFRTMGGTPADKTPPTDGVKTIGLASKYHVMTNLLTQQLGRPVVHGAQIRQILDDGLYDIIWHNNTSLVGGPGLLKLGTGLKIYEAHEHWLVCPTHVLWRYNRERCDTRHCLRCTLSHRRPPQLWRYGGLLENSLAHIDLLIAKSNFSQTMHARFGLKQDMTVLPYFLPDMAPKDMPAPALGDRPFFLFVGRLEKIKGLQDIFPAFEKYPDADLLILGDGDYSAELKRLAKGNGRIKFLGRLSLEELTAYYRAALALIVPSICYETFGIILIESFRFGTPVIARRLGPFPEIVQAAQGGLLFDTEAQLLDAMKSLQTDATYREKLGQAARRGFETHWREDVVLQAYGAALALAAHQHGDTKLARAFEAGAFENGAA